MISGNHLRGRLKAYELLLPIYVPGFLQYRMDHRDTVSFWPVSEHSEDATLWLPSTILTKFRLNICTPGLPLIEEKLRTAQCYDALDSICHILKLKTQMVEFKNWNMRGQQEGLRSQDIINRVHDHAVAAAEKYRTAQKAKLALSGCW